MTGLELCPSVPRDQNPYFQPHVLVVRDLGGGEKEWEIEHPDACPRVCRWWPGAREAAAEVERDAPLSLPIDELACYIASEVAYGGLDGIDLGDDPPDDGSYSPTSPFALDRWRQIPPGRWIIEGWYTPAYEAGSYGTIDADGGIALVGPEPRGSGGVAHYHFPRVWRGRHDERIVTFANGHVYDRAERRRSLRQLVRMMRREKTG